MMATLNCHISPRFVTKVRKSRYCRPNDKWATRRRRAETADAQNLQRIPSVRTIASPHDNWRDMLTKAETVTVAAIEAGVPTMVEAREIIAEFPLMIRRKTEVGLITWIERARASLVA
jgi:transposase